MFDNTGSSYNVSRILTSEYTLDVEAYEAYSPPYLSASYAILYMFFFAAYLACITHVLLYNWRDLSLGFKSVKDSINKGRGHWFRSSREQFTDVHNRLMMQCKWKSHSLLGHQPQKSGTSMFLHQLVGQFATNID